MFFLFRSARLRLATLALMRGDSTERRNEQVAGVWWASRSDSGGEGHSHCTKKIYPSFSKNILPISYIKGYCSYKMLGRYLSKVKVFVWKIYFILSQKPVSGHAISRLRYRFV